MGSSLPEPVTLGNVAKWRQPRRLREKIHSHQEMTDLYQPLLPETVPFRQPKASTVEENHVIQKTYCSMIALGSFQMNIWLSEGRRSFAMHPKKLRQRKRVF